MQKLLAMLVMGLFAFGAFAGCVGSEEANEVVIPEENIEEIPEETNETEVEEVAPIRENYHIKYSDSVTVVDNANGGIDYPFVVEEGALKMILTFTSSVTPGVTPIGDIGVWIYDTEGNEISSDFPCSGDTYVKELGEKDLKRGGYGEWNVGVCIQIPNVMADYEFTVDVLYS